MRTPGPRLIGGPDDPVRRRTGRSVQDQLRLGRRRPRRPRATKGQGNRAGGRATARLCCPAGWLTFPLGSLAAYQWRDIVLSQRPQMLTDLIVNLLTLRRMLVPVPEQRHQPFSTRWNPQVWYVSGDFDHPLRGGIGASKRSISSRAHAI